MNRLLVVVLVIVAALIAVMGSSVLRRSHELIPWQTDFQAGQAESHRTNKLILLDFSADWCGPCQEMRRTTWSDANVAVAMRDYIPMSVNIDANRALVSRFQVQAIPHIVVVNSRGDVLKMTTGAMDPNDFLHWLARPPER